MIQWWGVQFHLIFNSKEDVKTYYVFNSIKTQWIKTERQNEKSLECNSNNGNNYHNNNNTHTEIPWYPQGYKQTSQNNGADHESALYTRDSSANEAIQTILFIV